MVASEFHEALVQGMCNDVMVMVAGCKHSKEQRLQLESGAHTAEFKVAEPQLSM